jgi:hypothetical protein
VGSPGGTGLRITYQRGRIALAKPLFRNGEKNQQLPNGIDVGWTDFKVLAVIWHDDDRVVVVSYRGGPWEFWLKRKAEG